MKGATHQGRSEKTYLRRNEYFCKLIESIDRTKGDRAFASRERIVSAEFEIGEVLARATGKMYEIMEREGCADAKLKNLTMSMAAQAHAQLVKAKENGE